MSRKTKPELDTRDDEAVERDELTDEVADADAETADDAADNTADDATDSDSDSDAASAKRSSKGSASKNGRSSSKNGAAKRAGAKKNRPSNRKSGKSGASKSALVSGGKRPGKGGKASRGARPIKPVKVSSDTPWGTIALFTIVGLLVVGIVGYTSYLAWYSAKSPAERAKMISGVTDYNDKIGKAGQHDDSDLDYDMSPPVGGKHNNTWQNCMGDVYDKPIAEEHAVHSLEHGAIWITYRPDLPKSEVKKLEKKVRGKDFMMMSPYKGLKAPITLQAWGFQLKVDNADDERINEFIEALRTHGPEEGAACSGGITVTGDKPREVPPPQQPGMPGAPGGAPAPQPGG